MSTISFSEQIYTFDDALAAAEPRPTEGAPREEKKNYAQKLSHASAVLFAAHLRSYFPEILPGADGRVAESIPRTGRSLKRLDVTYSTIQLGLGLGLSIKTLNFRDPKTRRYTKNPTRIDNELRAEAMDHHERQPFSVLGALILMPMDACDDGDRTRPNKSSSSFAHVVDVLRHRVGRRTQRDEPQLFEFGFVGLYERVAAGRGSIGFFDLGSTPPQFGRPDLIDIGRLIARIVEIYDVRNYVKPPWESERTTVAFQELVERDLLPDGEDEDD